MNDDKWVVFLSLVGITLLLTLFEARARYLYIYAPLYIILAVKGLESLTAFLRQNRFYFGIPTLSGLERSGNRY